MSATSVELSFPKSLFFYTDESSVDSIMKKGIWHDTPTIECVKPLSSSSAFLLDKNGEAVIATDMKIKKCVLLHNAPFSKIESKNLATIFILEIDAKIMKCRDCYRVKKIHDASIDYLKNIMVDTSHINTIHVLTDHVKKQLQTHFKTQEIKIKIAVSPSLFGEVDEQLIPNKDIVIRTEEINLPLSVPPIAQNLISIRKGDLLASKMQTLVNTVNCVGVMGKGIAYSFKHRFPGMFKDYQLKCHKQQVTLGNPYLFVVSLFCRIVNFPTKGHWKENSKIENIEKGLQYLVAHAQEWGISSMAIPPLGCGNGGLSWSDVMPLMIRYLSQLNIPVEIYAPHEEAAFEVPVKRQRR